MLSARSEKLFLGSLATGALETGMLLLSQFALNLLGLLSSQLLGSRGHLRSLTYSTLFRCITVVSLVSFSLICPQPVLAETILTATYCEKLPYANAPFPNVDTV